MDPFFLALASLIVVIGPWKAAIVFAERTAHLPLDARRLVATGTVVISLAIAVVFLLIGDELIEFFHIDEAAFLVAAGLLILIFAIRMVILEPKDEGPIEPTAARRGVRGGLAAGGLSVVGARCWSPPQRSGRSWRSASRPTRTTSLRSG